MVPRGTMDGTRRMVSPLYDSFSEAGDGGGPTPASALCPASISCGPSLSPRRLPAYVARSWGTA